MAGEGPREWSPRGMAWVVFSDSPQGFRIELFKKERDAYHFAAYHAWGNIGWMEQSDAEKFSRLAEQKKYIEAMGFYNELADEYGSDRKPIFFTISRKFILQ